MAIAVDNFYTALSHTVVYYLTDFGFELVSLERQRDGSSWADLVRMTVKREGTVHYGKVGMNCFIDAYEISMMRDGAISVKLIDLAKRFMRQIVWHYKYRQIRTIWGLPYNRGDNGKRKVL